MSAVSLIAASAIMAIAAAILVAVGADAIVGPAFDPRTDIDWQLVFGTGIAMAAVIVTAVFARSLANPVDSEAFIGSHLTARVEQDSDIIDTLALAAARLDAAARDAGASVSAHANVSIQRDRRSAIEQASRLMTAVRPS
jgi:hypothetical protein